MLDNMILDVTIPATLRPELLERTLCGFVSRVRTSMQPRAIINIDKVPAGNLDKISDIITVVEKYIPLRAVFVAEFPSFAAAVRRVWRGSSAPFVFHLEDDWRFLRDIDLDWCVRVLSSGLSDYIRFSKRARFKISERDKVSLLPSLWRGDCVRKLSAVMTNTQDPEKQLRPGQGNEALDVLLPVRILDYPGGQCVEDTGRAWRDDRGIQKWDKNSNGNIVWK